MNYTAKEVNNEKWKAIDGYEGLYEVSDLGRVRSKHSGEWKVLRSGKKGGGYLQVNLYKDGKKKTLLVHRLVAQAFIPNSDDETKTQINHINECKSDNRVSNLEYCTAQYNLTYNGLQYRRNNPNYKCRKLKGLYDQNLSYKQNLEIFRANGVECSINIVWKLRKDLNLSQPKPKDIRSKIKHLFNPDLSINENLELFRENGIECSRTSLYRLRKDLGLIKTSV